MNIDQYIKKATGGLPSRERIDTAAELRVHLNAQVKKHLLEGHSREEAEFLAVDAMGAPAPVNRQLLGHMFTPQLGWRLVAGAVVAIGLWFGVQKLLEPRAGIYRVDTTVKDVTLAMGQNFYTFEFIAPQDARSLQIYQYFPDQKHLVVVPQPIPSDRKIRLNIRLGLNSQCPKGRMAAISVEQSSTNFTSYGGGFYCVLRKKSEYSSYTHGEPQSLTDFEINKWYSILNIQPMPDRDHKGNLIDPDSGYQYSQNPRNRFSYFVMFSKQDQ